MKRKQISEDASEQVMHLIGDDNATQKGVRYKLSRYIAPRLGGRKNIRERRNNGYLLQISNGIKRKTSVSLM